jgi:hypothetical protein
VCYNTHKGGKRMSNKKIDFVIHEADMNRLERINKKLFIENIILILIIFLIFGCLIVYSTIPSESVTGTQEIKDIQGSTVTNIGK